MKVSVFCLEKKTFFFNLDFFAIQCQYILTDSKLKPFSSQTDVCNDFSYTLDSDDLIRRQTEEEKFENDIL